MVDVQSEAAPGGGGGDNTTQDSTREQAKYASPGEKKKAISSLSELSEVRNYLNRIEAEPRGLRSAVVKEVVGKYWRDIAVIKFAKDGTVDCREPEYLPTESEAKAIERAFASAQWPEIQTLREIENPPKMIREAQQKDFEANRADPKANVKSVFKFRGEDGKIIMVQVRMELDNGDKAYLPWTYWDDGQWRMCEPEGPLPLYNMDKLKGHAVVFIHEGAKGARHCQRLAEARTFQDKDDLKAHPWGDHLEYGVHVGWIGGAMNPYRTDWDVLRKAGIKRAYIVADNDDQGRAAVPKIAQHLRMEACQILFDDRFVPAFDLGDPFPDNLFQEQGGQQVYVGPSFLDCLAPATWATSLIPNPKGRPTPVLREEFAKQWASVVTPPVFVWDQNGRVLSKEEFNRSVRPFSDTNDTAALLERKAENQFAALDYRPDRGNEQAITGPNGRTRNVFRPARFRGGRGNPPSAEALRPWTEFLEHLIPDPSDRTEVERWCATLIAKPEVRMTYSLLLVSEAQGVGKTTLAEKVLRPLVGEWNTSIPSAEQVTGSNFNGWAAHKRLVIVNELYAGNNDKVYNALKSVVADDTIEVNQKYMVPYEVSNWCHVVASSNSFRCLRLVEEDRRWLVPSVTEEKKPQEYWHAFNEWLKGDGLRIIFDWACNYRDDYVPQGQHAPNTQQKQRMIDESLTPGQRLARSLAEAMTETDERVVVTENDVLAWVQERRKTEDGAAVRMEGKDTLRRAMKAVEGVWVCDHASRPKANGVKQYVVANFVPDDTVGRTGSGALSWAPLRDVCRLPKDLMPDPM